MLLDTAVQLHVLAPLRRLLHAVVTQYKVVRDILRLLMLKVESRMGNICTLLTEDLGMAWG